MKSFKAAVFARLKVGFDPRFFRLFAVNAEDLPIEASSLSFPPPSPPPPPSLSNPLPSPSPPCDPRVAPYVVVGLFGINVFANSKSNSFGNS